MSVCGSCGDLNDPGAERCEGCGERLLPTESELRHIRRYLKSIRRPKAAPDRRGL